jgi:WD40 repeat protein
VWQLQVHDDAIRSVAFSPNERFMASSSSDGSIMIWKLMIGGIETSLKDLSLRSGSLSGVTYELVEQLKGSEMGVESVRFTLDGRFLLSAGTDQSICVWGTDGWNLVATCEGHSDWVECLTPIPGGSEFFSSSVDGTILRWKESSSTSSSSSSD